MYKMRERRFNNFYTKVALFALIALIGIFCGTLLFFNSFTQNNSESKKIFAATNVTTEAELVNALNNGETSITLSENITVTSTINLSEVTISGSTRTLTISSTGVVNVGNNVTINISSIIVNGLLNVADGTIQNDITVTNSGICNIIGGTIDGDVVVNSSAQLNFAEPTSASISITGTINLDNGRYINVEYPITNSTNRFKVHVNDEAVDRVVVKFDKDITNTQVVASTFQPYNNPAFNFIKEQVGSGSDAYYVLKLQANSAVVNYVAYNGSDSLTGAPNVAVKLNGAEVGVLSPTNTCIVLGATNGTLNLTGNYISVNADFTSNPTNLSTCSSKTYTINGATNYDVYVRDIYTITMDPNGGNNATTRYKVHGLAQNINYGAKPVKQHYEFVNWNTASDGTGTPYENGASYTTNSDLLVYAQWTNGNSDYSVRHYVMNTSGEYSSNPTSSESKSGIFGSTINTADLVKSSLLVSYGIEFDHAEVDGVTVAQTTISEDDSRVINMYYRRLQHTLILSRGLGISTVINGGIETTGAVSYYYGQSASIDATVVNDDYVWKNWTGYQTLNSKSTTVQIPAQDISLMANAVEEVKYDITIVVNNASFGTVSPASFQARNNSNITISGNKIIIGGTTVTATPHPNDTDGVKYSFVEWNGPDVTTVTEDLTFTANFKKEYRVRWYDGDNNLLATDYLEPGEIPNWDSTRPAPTKTSDDMCDYVWNGGWDGTAWIQPLVGPVDIRAIFDNILRKYTVTWLNYDGSVTLETDSDVNAGTQPSYDSAEPEGPSTDQISYTFIGWSTSPNSTTGTAESNLPPVTGNTTYYAAFSQSTAEYTVTWKNYDGSVTLETDPYVPYGSYPSYGGAQPERANENHHVYTFVGWSTSPNSTTGTTESGLPAVSGNITYYAAFSEATETFTVTWRNYDDELIETDTDVPYGSRPSYDYSVPSKPFDDNTGKEYTFIGWALSPDSTTATAASDLPDVSANVTYFAIFSSAPKLYTIIWMNYDGLGEPLATYPNLPWHTVPYYHEETPTRTGEGVIYTFKGWSDVPNSGLWLDPLPQTSGSNSIITYYAVFGVEAKKYTVIWKNWDGTDTLDTSENVSYGTTPTYSGATPTMEEPGVTYNFVGWATAPNSTTGITIPPVTGEETIVVYYAVFTSETKTYTVIWKNWDGSGQALETDYDVPYGSVPQFDSAEPQIDSTAEFEYTFVGWAIAPNSAEGIVLQALTGEEATVTYYAAFTKDKRKYEITFRQQNDDGVTYTTLQKSDVEYGELPVYTGATPTKESTAQYNYTFSGWSPQLSTVTGEAVYTAQFASETQEYTIIWKNYDGTTLASVMVPYGTVPTYAGTPEKQGDEQYEYTFDKWVDGEGNEPVAVTGNATYTATFIQVVNQYKIKISFENNVNQNIDPEVTIKINGQDVDVYEITSNGILFDYGTEISLVALIQGKYNLSWTENGREATRINNLQMDNFQLKKDEDFTLYISQIFTISVVYDDTMGSVDKGESVSVLRGDDIKMTASANNGYKFVTWVKGEGSYYNAQNLNKAQVTILGVSGNCEITAEFEIVVYKIRIFVDGVLTEMDYTITSQAVTLPTPSKDGYKFLGWTGSNGSKPEKNITIASGSFGDKVFYAEFTKPEGNEKLIIILAVAAAVVVTGVIITIIVIAKNKRGRRRRRPITIDLSRFK